MDLIEFFKNKKKNRDEKVQEAREKFSSWLAISNSPGWKIYEEKVDKKIEIIKNQLANDTALTGEDLKRLQLALQVWKTVKMIPKELRENAVRGEK